LIELGILRGSGVTLLLVEVRLLTTEEVGEEVLGLLKLDEVRVLRGGVQGRETARSDSMRCSTN
jgi:hypothetical protein